MARPVRVRKSYTGDRSRLSRLEEAVEKDSRLPDEKKAEALGLIRQLVVLLMEIDGDLTQASQEFPNRKRSKKTGKKNGKLARRSAVA